MPAWQVHSHEFDPQFQKTIVAMEFTVCSQESVFEIHLFTYNLGIIVSVYGVWCMVNENYVQEVIHNGNNYGLKCCLSSILYTAEGIGR